MEIGLIGYGLLLLALFLLILAIHCLNVKKTHRKKLWMEHHASPGYFEKLQVVNRDLSPYGFAYDFRHNTFFTKKNAWLRQSGYSTAYDSYAIRFGAIFDSDSIFFEYEGKRWLVFIRKGQYTTFTGAEVGIFMEAERPDYAPSSLNDDYYLPIREEYYPRISFSLWKNGDVILNRSARHWWLTGFSLGTFAEPDDLSMHVEISFSETNMCNAFKQALTLKGYGEEDFISCGRNVWILFNKPHSRINGLKRTKKTRRTQKWNRFRVYLCNRNGLYSKDPNMINQLVYVKQNRPLYYKRILRSFFRLKMFLSGSA